VHRSINLRLAGGSALIVAACIAVGALKIQYAATQVDAIIFRCRRYLFRVYFCRRSREHNLKYKWRRDGTCSNAPIAPIPHAFHSGRRNILCCTGEFHSGSREVQVHAKDELEGVIAAQARNPGGSLIWMPNGFNAANHELIFVLAARYGVPSIYFNRLSAGSGGLISYGSDFAQLFRQAAGYIDRILKGAKPGELPIQLSTKFELVINLKTAKALGFTVPPTLLVAADEVIE
jgi:hypothetical protein